MMSESIFKEDKIRKAIRKQEKEHKRKYEEITEEVDEFFENAKKYNLEQRDEQHSFAFAIMEALRDKEVLVIEAGVGTGKTKGYLVPIFESLKNDEKFQGAIISTSSISLQEQIAKEVEEVAKILNMNIPTVTVIKGKNNYVCMNRVSTQQDQNRNQNNLNYALPKIAKSLFDRKDYPELTESEWNTINITHCYFDNCPKASECHYYALRKQALQSDIIICNHDLTIEHLKREDENPILKVPSILVMDEAHTLEDKIRNSYTRTLEKDKIESTACEIANSIFGKFDKNRKIPSDFFNSLNNLFYNFGKNSKDELIKILDNGCDYTGCSRVCIEWNDDSRKQIETILGTLKFLEKETEKYINERYINFNDKFSGKEKLKSNYNNLRIYIDAFLELLKDNSKYAYWLEFISSNDHIKISYAPKDISEIGKELLESNNYTKVMTSATLTENNSYEYFNANIGISKIKGQKAYVEDPIPSPYNFNENALVYIPCYIRNPKDRENYLDDITKEIIELTTLTNGKTLVLFTSKNDLNIIYQNLNDVSSLKYNLLAQSDSKKLDVLKEEFIENPNSILLSTGAWEGFDIKGNTLSSVIIPRLPFPLQDPIIKSKASIYQDPMTNVYLKEMAIKLRQGMGRLIRSEEDTGIISLLDQRVYNYYQYIENLLPTNNITFERKDVEEFVKQKKI